MKQTEVLLPSGVSSILNSFYGYKNLISITIPKSVRSINDSAFYGCDNLSYIEVDSENNSYYSQNGVLYNKECTQIICVPEKIVGVITIPNGITNINAYSFNNTLVTSVEIPNSVTAISKGAFEGCNNLISITLPFVGSSLDGSETECFGYIFGASKYSENATYVPETLKSVEINQGNIAEYAFSNCSNIETIVFSDSVTTIGNKALYACDNLQSLTVPFVGSGSVDKFDHHLASLFNECSYGYYSSTYDFSDNLKNVIVTGGDTIGSYAFAYCGTLENVTLPDTIETIGEYAFSNCSLKEIIISKSVLNIGNNAFSGCYNINKTIYTGKLSEWVKINFSNTYSNPIVLSKNLYIENSLIEDVVLTDSIKINQYAFSNLKTLKSISLSESILCIYDNAFSECENLNRVYYEGTSRDWDGIEIKSGNEYLETALRSYDYTICCDHPKCNTETIKESTCIEEGKIKFTCENCNLSFEVLTPISQHVCSEDGLCAHCNLELFDYYLFSDIEGAICINGFSSFLNEMRPTELIIPKTYKGYRVIEVGGFDNCDKINTVILPDTIREINHSAFSHCTSLISINIPKGVTIIEGYAFYCCDNLSIIDLPSTITTIGAYAFGGCTGLTSFSIPYSVTSLGDGALPSDTLLRVSIYNDGLNIYNLNLSSNVDICAAENSKAHLYALDNGNVFIPHIHTYAESKIIASTCQEKGYTIYICLECQQEYNDNFTDVIAHTASNWIEDSPSTCKTAGSKHKECTMCRTVLETDLIPVADHTYDNICDAICNVCGEQRVVSHNYANATCTVPKTCKLCGVTSGAALGHSFTNYASNNDATCITDGTKTAVCDRCNATNTIVDENSAIGHSFTDYVSDNNGTCTADGTKTAKCDRCEVTDTNSALGHSFTNYVSDNNATCTADGTKTAKCDNCDATDTIEESDSATGHSFGEWYVILEPTYFDEGAEERECSVCSEKESNTLPVKEYVNPFTDVKESAWFYDAVSYVVKKGYMNGMSATKFSSNSNITREQFVLILANIAGVDTNEYKYTESGFADVPTGQWYSGAVTWAVNEGYVSGMSADKFGRGQSIQRAALARMLYNYASKNGISVNGRADLSSFGDAKEFDKAGNAWMVEPVQWAVDAGIISGMTVDGVNCVNPKGTTTRAQAARMLMQFDALLSD